MQRALRHDLSPPAALPLRFLLASPWFGALAGLVLLAAGAPALASRWSPALLAITHLLTLGCLGMAMLGAILQLVPAVAGQIIAMPRTLTLAAWAGLALGASSLAAAFLLSLQWLYIGAAVLLAPACAAPALAALRALSKPLASGARPMARAMRMALAALLATITLGVALASYLGAGWPVPVLVLLDLHMLWGLLGWVSMLIAGVSFQVIPMFLQTRVYPQAASRHGVWLLMLLLLGWSLVRVAAPDAIAWPGALLAFVLASYALLTLRMLAQRRRQPIDATNLYWMLSLASLAGACVLYALDGAMLATGVLFFAGFALGALNGMLYKIVPFLLWYDMQLDAPPRAPALPAMRLLVPPARALWQLGAHALALVLLAAALYWPLLARPAGLAFTAAYLLLAHDLTRATLLCRKVRRAWGAPQPS